LSLRQKSSIFDTSLIRGRLGADGARRGFLSLRQKSPIFDTSLIRGRLGAGRAAAGRLQGSL
ncbi:MAG: hypothetical protein DBY36_07360, partial [Clostridiales bacterium]